MIIAIFAIVCGFIALAWSADKFVGGAAVIAKSWGVSLMLIGLTVVSIGTSLPEILVSIMAASQGHSEIGVGNAIGSSIANIGLVLGVTALIAPLSINQSLARREIPWLVLVTIVVGGCLASGHLGIQDSIVLFSFLVITLYLMFRWQKSHSDTSVIQINDLSPMSISSAWFNLIVGLIILLASSQALVWGAVRIAELIGISDLIIGLTIVAIGTSLPELALSIVSARRGQPDIVLGMIVGSNIFNLLAVLAVPGLIAPSKLDDLVILRDYPVMLVLTALLAIFCLGRKQKIIGKIAGLVFILCYAIYGVLLYIQGT